MSCLASEAVDDLLLGSTKDIVDAVNLVELVFAWEKRLLGGELEQDASEPPNIHLFVVVSIGEETLRGSVPASRDVVSVGSWRMLALARAKIGKFY